MLHGDDEVEKKVRRAAFGGGLQGKLYGFWFPELRTLASEIKFLNLKQQSQEISQLHLKSPTFNDTMLYYGKWSQWWVDLS